MTENLIALFKLLVPQIEFEVVNQGAEAIVFSTSSHPYYNDPYSFDRKKVIIKYRPSKAYRHPKIDASIIKSRTIGEVKFMTKLQKLGINAPYVIMADYNSGLIWMNHLGDSLPNGDPSSLKNYLWYLEKNNLNCDDAKVKQIITNVGKLVGQLHNHDMVHGDLTTSNVLLVNFEPYLIDFGLSSQGIMPEDKAVDLYVLERAVESTHSQYSQIYNDWILQGYKLGFKKEKKCSEVMHRLEDVRLRGRKRSMLG